MAESITHQLLTLAAATGGVCTRAQLVEAGIAGSAIDRRLRSGLLQPVCIGVFHVPVLADDTTPLHRALLAIKGSALSRETAAAIHGFPIPRGPDVVHVTVDHGSYHALERVSVHQSRRLEPIDLVRTETLLVVTSPARTIVDLAGTVPYRRLRHLIGRQLSVGKPSKDELVECFERLDQRGRPGRENLRRSLNELTDERPVPQSELEARVWLELRSRGLSGFRPQFMPPWFDGIRGAVDFADPKSRVILEADGRRWHAAEAAMAEDRRRDRIAAVNGWLVLRVLWDDVVSRPDATFDDVRRTVERRSQAAA